MGPRIGFLWRDRDRVAGLMSIERPLRVFLWAGLCLALGCGNGDSGEGGIGGVGGTGGTGGAAPLDLEVTATAGLFRAVQGEIVAAPLEVSRGPGLTGPVEITVQGSPVGVAFAPLTIASGANSGEIDISAVVTAPQGGPSIVTLAAVLTPEGADPVEHITEVPLWVAGPRHTLDSSFGSSGNVGIADISLVRDAAVDSQGRIVLLGTPGGSPTIQRLAQNGSNDSTFGVDGRVSDVAPSPDLIALAVLEADDRIVVGTRGETFDDPPFVRAFRGSDGQVDTSFGDAGDRTVSGRNAPRLASRPGGLFVLTSEEIIALTTDGDLDPSFAPLSLPNFYETVHADGNGRALLHRVYRIAATLETGAELLRLLPGGEPDPAFGTGGVALVRGATGEDLSVRSQIGMAPNGDGLVALTIADFSDAFRSSIYARFFGDGTIDSAAIIGVVDFLSSGVGVADDGRAFVAGGFDRTGDPQYRVHVQEPGGSGFTAVDAIGFSTRKILVERKVQRLIVIGNPSSQTAIRRYWL